MVIRQARMNDSPWLAKHDRHLSEEAVETKIERGEIYVAEGDDIVGWLRFSLFWDFIPFMNMLFVLEPFRGQGIGSALTDHWEEEMIRRGYPDLMTSTLSDELAQHFYRKRGYRDIGGFIMPGEALELLLFKKRQH